MRSGSVSDAASKSDIPSQKGSRNNVDVNLDIKANVEYQGTSNAKSGSRINVDEALGSKYTAATTGLNGIYIIFIY